MDTATRDKWDRAAGNFDLMAGFGPEKRWRPVKEKLFANMRGKILFMAVGTGLDISCFPPGQDITGIDISPKMLDKAAPRAAAYDGTMTLRQMDIHDADFADDTFDQVFTSCTFCSVPDPVAGLKVLKRILKPGGELFMFEHTGSRIFPFNIMMNVMNPLFRRFGPEVNRDTVANVAAGGFQVRRVSNVYLDMLKIIEAVA